VIYGFEQVFSVMRYPAGESHVEIRHLPITQRDVIQVSNCRGFEDLCNVVTAAEILRNLGRVEPTWFIPYFPFGRHDRRRERGDGLELKVALDLVSHLDVVTMDPHSDVLGQLRHIPQVAVVDCMNKHFGIFDEPAGQVVVIPDHGGVKKAAAWLDGRDVAQGFKKRDPSTGSLSGFDVDRGDFHGCPCLIVDDICDGGGTFIGLADVLKDRGAGALTLAVSHGLFTKGTEELAKWFDRIISTGPFKESNVARVPHHLIFEAGGFV